MRMFVSKLRDDDAFGLVEFKEQSKTLIPCDLKKNLDLPTVFAIIDGLAAGGGTVLSTGFNEASRNLNTFFSKNAKDTNC